MFTGIITRQNMSRSRNDHLQVHIHVLKRFNFARKIVHRRALFIALPVFQVKSNRAVNGRRGKDVCEYACTPSCDLGISVRAKHINDSML